ncbi:MAG: DUF1572 family protein [Anaerolineales bacterium]|nr:DUF1572 family protein [Anaerolineales bacterium]
MQPYFEDYLLNLQELHNDILNTLKDLPPAALDWSPALDVNSINVLVVHTTGAQRFLIGEAVGGDPANRDREAEFKVQGLDADALTQRLNESFEYIRSVMDDLTVDDLASTRDFRGRKKSVAWILDHALKHTATHMGHIQLMRQVWEMYGEGD